MTLEDKKKKFQQQIDALQQRQSPAPAPGGEVGASTLGAASLQRTIRLRDGWMQA